ncbi:MAG: MbcA/ParS/Xre antitoxin family protein [Holophaga sp.]
MSALTEPTFPASYPDGPEAVALARAGLAGFARFAEVWGLTVDQQRHLLGGLPKATYYGLLRGTIRTVNRDTLERLSLLAGIWIDLEILVPDREAALGWLRRSHPDPRFGGASPLAWMLQGSVSALVDVRRYLEEWRYSW